MLQDLHLVGELEESDLRLIRLSTQQLAHISTKRTREGGEPRFQNDQLLGIRDMIDGVEERLKVLPIKTYGAATRSLVLDAPGTKPVEESDLGQRFFERFLRAENVNGLAGPMKVQPGFVPIDFLLVEEYATTFDDALAAMRYADKVSLARRLFRGNSLSVERDVTLSTKLVPPP